MTQQDALERIAEGREAEIFARDDGTVLKLYREGASPEQPAHEAAAMEAAAEAGAPVPASHGVTTAMGRPGLIMERVDGLDLLTQIGKKPWTIFPAGSAMGRAHAALHAAQAPASLPVIKQVMPGLIRESTLVPDDLGGFAIEALSRLPDGDRLCHGDYHPANVIMTAKGPIVIDWPNAAAGDPHADVARTVLTLRIAQVPEDQPAWLRAMTGVGRRILLSRYLAAYRKSRPLDMALVERWIVPVAAHRLREEVTGEREVILRLLRSAMNASNASRAG